MLKTQEDKVSYAIGISIAKSLKRDSIEVEPAILLRGLKDELAGGKLLLTDEEAKAAITAIQKEAHEKQEAKMKMAGEENKKQGEAFLAANKSKEGVVTLPSGLQYKIEKQGDGPKPTATDTVECNYRGTLINGKEFDSSYKRGKPATFPVSGVIQGWTEILQLMPVGSKYQVFIPSELAYKARAALVLTSAPTPPSSSRSNSSPSSRSPRPPLLPLLPPSPKRPPPTKPAEPAK